MMDLTMKLNGASLTATEESSPSEEEEESSTTTQAPPPPQAPQSQASTSEVQKYTKGEGYAATLAKIKQVKGAKDPSNPLVLHLERHGWNSRANAWHRFLAARDGNVTLALQMMEENETWRKKSFPIDLKQEGLQKILNSRAISEIDIKHEGLPPTVYVDFSKLQALEEGVSSQNVVDAFVIVTETLLSRSANPGSPKTCQFIDLSDTHISSGFRVSILKEIYAVFEPNYPETLEKMIMYPVSAFVVSAHTIPFNIDKSIHIQCNQFFWSSAAIGNGSNFCLHLHLHLHLYLYRGEQHRCY